MDRSIDALEAQLLKLPSADRARLAERRLSELRRGVVAGVPGAPRFERARVVR